MSIQSFEEFTRLNSSKIEPISKKIEPLSKTPLVKESKLLKESAFLVGDDYKVKVVLDIPKSLVQQYIQKVKDETDKDPLDTFSESEIAEQIVSFLIKTNLKIDNLTPEFTVGSDIENDTETDTEEGLQEIEDDNSFDYSTKSKPFKKENDIEMDIPKDKDKDKDKGKNENDFEEISFDKVELDETKPTPDISVSKKPKTIGDLKKQEKSFDIVLPQNQQSEEEEISRLYKTATGYDYDRDGQYEKIYFDLKNVYKI